MAKQPKAKVKQVRNVKNLRIKLLIIPAIALLIKLIIIAKIPGHAWLGADGENYLTGVDGLLKDGFFSKENKLSYWPAGYPILLVINSLINHQWILTFASISQSVLYFIGCGYFVDQIRRTRISKFSFLIAIVLAFNPTLSLSSIAIGYEAPAAALFLIALGLMIDSYISKKEKFISKQLILASIAISLASFMQPRLSVCGFGILLAWGMATRSKKILVGFLISSVLIVSTTPVIMMIRNQITNGYFGISTNFGGAMNIGAGDKAKGGYSTTDIGVPCDQIAGDSAAQDRHVVQCVTKWYLANPTKSLKLFWNKSVYLWSPWFGPLANGTMARNPWLKIHPLKETIKTQDGFNMVFGNSGKLVSWAWIIGQILFIGLGFRFLWKASGLEQLLGTAALAPIIINWLSVLVTIGDNRFRLPMMGLSLFLQAVGFVSLFGGKSRLTGSVNPLRWKSLERKANLLP